MGVLYDYFLCGEPAQMRQLLDEHSGQSPVIAGLCEGVDAKGIDYTVGLGQAVALSQGVPWSVDLMANELVWPADDDDGEGPFVIVYTRLAVELLAKVDAARVAPPWALTEEFGGRADPSDLAHVLAELTALARKAIAEDKHLYCWCSL
ncbi:hypothetical protein [Catelliglobosispora koreensis]|uniref:hypothetical protein n=1 Tax=Catelliglobosispora koreensis TaxID=129052 RepID=UPI00039CB3F0|nr:hypothetical protein [Catelliglobosispora koreensis]